MYKIPVPKLQSLSSALAYIARHANSGKHSEEIESSLLAAFRDGTLQARAHKYHDESDTYDLETIPSTFWQLLEKSEFHHFLNNDGNTTAHVRIDDETPRYTNAQIKTSDLDKWLGIKRGGALVEVRMAEKLDLPFLKKHYSRYVVDGSIKTHQLAALVVSRLTVGNISAPEASDYKAELANIHTPVGQVFDKLKRGILKGAIRPIIEGRDIEHHEIDLVRALEWLKPQLDKVGMKIDQPLQLYADDLHKEEKERLQLMKQTPPSIWSGSKEPLIPYRHTESKLITISSVKDRLSVATKTNFWEDATQQLIIEALKAKKIVGIALKGKEMYELPPIFWEISYLSSFSVGAFNAFWEGVVDNMLDSERIADLHTIHGWPIVFEEDSFEKWLHSLDKSTNKNAPNRVGRSSGKDQIYAALSQISREDLNSLKIEKRGLADAVAKICNKQIGDRNFSLKAVSRHIASYLANIKEDKTAA